MTTKKTGTTKKATTKTSPAKAVATKPKAAPAKAVAKPAAPVSMKPAKPVKSPLGKKEMEPYRHLLLELKHKLVRDVLVNQEASNESNDGDVLDLADQASDSYDKDLANSLSETERARLAAVEKALKRVEAGTYGLCEDCTKPIPLPRLKVLPFAKLCVNCQQSEERGNSWRVRSQEEEK
ncbi:MAG TPA: TraR/DksA family transcriptional regulator [bacterium]|nr:TraR/DksA family transcriptional regulator [bacterium]